MWVRILWEWVHVFGVYCLWWISVVCEHYSTCFWIMSWLFQEFVLIVHEWYVMNKCWNIDFLVIFEDWWVCSILFWSPYFAMFMNTHQSTLTHTHTHTHTHACTSTLYIVTMCKSSVGERGACTLLESFFSGKKISVGILELPFLQTCRVLKTVISQLCSVCVCFVYSLLRHRDTFPLIVVEVHTHFWAFALVQRWIIGAVTINISIVVRTGLSFGFDVLFLCQNRDGQRPRIILDFVSVWDQRFKLENNIGSIYSKDWRSETALRTAFGFATFTSSSSVLIGWTSGWEIHLGIWYYLVTCL
jgi:hypothetical protein